ncbi:MAG TPA: hypothetical protein VL527_15080 [Dongiaceae bacterium]|nr:hypothetical protein [Dongiaceae bacterium]
MFTVIGVLMSIYGLANRAGSMSLEININLIWGVVLLVFGVFMLVMAMLGRQKS